MEKVIYVERERVGGLGVIFIIVQQLWRIVCSVPLWPKYLALAIRKGQAVKKYKAEGKNSEEIEELLEPIHAEKMRLDVIHRKICFGTGALIFFSFIAFAVYMEYFD